MIRFLQKPVARVDLSKARPGDRFKFANRLYKVPVVWRPTAAAVCLLTYCEVCGTAFLFTCGRRPARLRKWCSPCARGSAPRPDPAPNVPSRPPFSPNTKQRTHENERSPQ